LNWGWGRSCTACSGSQAPRPPALLDDPGDKDWKERGLKRFEPMFELEHRQAPSQLTPRAGVARDYLGSPFDTGGQSAFGVLALGPRRDNQCRVAPDRGRLYLRRRLPLLLEIPRRQKSLASIRAAPHRPSGFNNGHDFVPDEQVGAVRASLCRDRWRRPARGAGARSAVRLSARHDLARHRCRAGRRGAGLHDSLLLAPA